MFVVSIYVVETPKARIKDHEPPLPKTSFGIVEYSFVGQPFSKQLYTYGSDLFTIEFINEMFSFYLSEFSCYFKQDNVTVILLLTPVTVT